MPYSSRMHKKKRPRLGSAYGKQTSPALMLFYNECYGNGQIAARMHGLPFLSMFCPHSNTQCLVIVQRWGKPFACGLGRYCICCWHRSIWRIAILKGNFPCFTHKAVSQRRGACAICLFHDTFTIFRLPWEKAHA